MSKVRFVDSSIRVNSGGGDGGGSSISASYALTSSYSNFSISSSYVATASYSNFATSASYAISASHEIVKEVSSSYADTASLAQSGNGPFTGSFTGSFFGNGAGVFSGSFSGSIPDAFQIISGSVSASISPDNGLKINSPVDITMPSGSVFTIHEPDMDQQNRLNFKFDQGNPILEIASRFTTSSLHLKQDQTGNGLLLTSNGFLKYISGVNTYGVQFTTEFKPIDTTGAIPLGFYNRRWADLYLFNGKKISFGTNSSPYPDLVSFRHTAGTNTLVMSGSSDVSLDVKGVVSASRFTVSSSADTIPGYTFWNNSTTGMLSNSPTNLKFQVDGTSSPELELNTGQATFRTPVSFTDNEISSVSKIRNLGSISASGDFSSSITSTASFGTYLGDGSQLTGIETDPFPYTGSAIISGSLQIKGSGNTFATTPILIENSDGDDLIKVLDSGRFFIGKGAANADDSNVVYGNSANAQGSNNIAIGNSANAQGGTYNVAIGGTVASVNYGIGIGSAYIGGAESVGVGYSSRTSAGTVAIGHDSGPESAGDGEQSIYIGNEAKGTADNSIVLNANGGSTITSATETNSFKVFMSSASTPDFQVTNTHITASGNISGSATSTASFGTYLGDGSQLTGIETDPFPFIGDAQITGSLEITGSLKMIRPSNKLDLSIGSNIIIGREAGNSISDDRGAIFLGYKSGYTNTSPSSNIAIGYGAGGALGTNASQQNIFMGYLAGAGNTSIGSITSRMSQASNNIGMGYQALLYLTSGDQNIALGTAVMRNISTGGNNTAFGAYALYNTDSGDNNIGIGYYAGLNQTSGDGNITIGSGSLGVAGESNQLRIGQGNGDALIHGDFASQSLSINGSGSIVFDVIGSQGTLFSVDDDLSGTLFTANDVSGLPVLEASASGEVYIGKSPQSLYTTAVISSTTAATTQSIFGLSTSSYDSAFFDYTVQSGSNARAGSIMSVWSGSTINYTETTTTDIGNTTDFNLIVHISQSQAQIASHATNAGYKIKTIIRSI